MRHPRARWAILAATFFLLEMTDMSDRAIRFESTQTGTTPASAAPAPHGEERL